MTLPSATLFPQALLPLYIFEPRYRRMLADALKQHRMFTVAMQKPGRSREIPCGVAGLGLIRVSVDHQDGTSHLILQGLTRVELCETVRYKPYRVQRIQPLETPQDDSIIVDALLAKVLELVRARLQNGSSPLPTPLLKQVKTNADDEKPSSFSANTSATDILKYLESLTDAAQIADLVACAILTDPQERQTILETVALEARLKHLIHFLMADPLG